MTNIFPIDFEEKNTIANDDFILFSDSEDGNKLKKAQYSNLKWEQWDPWTPWAAATISVGTVSTGVPGSSVTITNSGTSSAAVFDFSIPQGAKWDTGSTWSAATITVGTTTTWAAGTNASVTNSGTSSAAVLNFTIPRWADGTGSGDVVWPASSTDWHLAVFDWVTGKLIKDGGTVPVVPSTISSFTNDSWYLTSTTGVSSVNSQNWAVTVTEFTPTSAWTTGYVLKKTADWYDREAESGAVTSVNWQTWAVTVTEFTPSGTATTGYVVTKTAWGYEWAAPSGWIENVTTGTTTTVTGIRAGTEAEYGDITTPSASVLYFTF